MRAVAGAILLIGTLAVGKDEGFLGFMTGIYIGFGLLLVIVGFIADGGRS